MINTFSVNLSLSINLFLLDYIGYSYSTINSISSVRRFYIGWYGNYWMGGIFKKRLIDKIESSLDYIFYTGTDDESIRVYDVKSFNCYTASTNQNDLHHGGITRVKSYIHL